MGLSDPSFVDREAMGALRPRFLETKCAGVYASGSLDGLAAPTVGVVGCRAPSESGRRLAHATARALGEAGVCVISGLALGIDGAAHEGALAARAPTLGILGGGHRRFFPPRHRELAERVIAGGGAVISPFEPDRQAQPWHFLARNALVAALSDAVLVVEAAARSGALNTASWAADFNVPVFAFPGDVDRPKVAGCHALIREGATLARNAQDVLSGIGIAAQPLPTQSRLDLRPDDARVATLLQAGTLDIDALVVASGLSVAAVNAALVRLEIDGSFGTALNRRKES